MKLERVQSFETPAGIMRVGQRVIFIASGSDEPKIKKIVQILVAHWDPNEAARHKVPANEVTYRFADSTSGTWEDDVIPA